MTNRLFGPFAILVVVTGAFQTTGWSREAPRSFESQNGLLSEEKFDAARQAFAEIETPATGLGIHFNDSSCAGCHVAPGVGRLIGGSGPITELRAGYTVSNGETRPAPGGTLITMNAVGGATPEIQALSESQNVRERFITPSLFGAGFVEFVPDEVLRRVARDQARRSRGRIQGFVREVPILEAPGETAVGRFGWAAQHASLLSFAADAYRNEMGITSPLQPDDNTFLGNPVGDGVADPEDTGGEFGEDVELFADFMRALAAPPLHPSAEEDRREFERGARKFEDIGCDACHLPELETASSGTRFYGDTFRVPRELGSKKFHPYSDFLLHNIGTGPSILREGLPPEAQGMIRTAALWGLGTRLANGEPLLHDGSARTVEEAILRHENSAANEAGEFQRLNDRERMRLLKFLRGL